MIKVAICDDEKIMRNQLKKRLDEYSWKRNIDIEYSEFENGLDFLKDSSGFDIVFMDYQINEDKRINGVSVARKLRDRDDDIIIIFLTGFEKVVFSCFEVNAFRFLVKPLEPEKLFKAMDDYLKIVDKDEFLLTLKSYGESRVLDVKKILYIEGMGKYSLIHIRDEEIECHETLAEMEKKVPGDLFFRCHRSFLINFKYVKAYDSNEIVLKNGQTAAVGARRLEEFKKAFIDYTKRYR